MYVKLSSNLNRLMDRYSQPVKKHSADKRIKSLLETLIDDAVMPYMKFYPPEPPDKGYNPRYVRDIGLVYTSRQSNPTQVGSRDVRTRISVLGEDGKIKKAYHWERVKLYSNEKIIRPSEQMHERWKIKETLSGYIVTNTASYSGLMYYASRQPYFHAKRKWPNDVGLQKRIKKRLETLAQIRGVAVYVTMGK